MSIAVAANPFRAQWLYRRLPAADAMLAAGRGLSPAFLRLLEAIDAGAGVSFSALEAGFPQMDADDLELWLAELCRMDLIVPAEAADTLTMAREVGDDMAPAAESDPSLDPSPDASLAALAGVDADPAQIRLLLVHKLPSTRLAWRDLLAGLPVQLSEAGSLEEADAAYNRLLPQAVVLGPEGGDFNALNLIHVLKHPRAPRPTKVFLVLDEKSWSAKIKSAAARADDTVTADAWSSLGERVARHLSLSVKPAPAPVAHQTTGQFSVAESLLYARVDPHAALASTLGALESEYPRVAAVLADQWSSETLDELFDQLIFDDRCERAGFSAAAMEDLLFLYRIHSELRPRVDSWDPSVQPHTRRGRQASLRLTGRHRSLASASQRLG